MDSDFSGVSATFKNAFWEIGAAILGKTRVGTVFDDNAQIAEADSDGDNIDIAHATAGKLSILRPVLKPALHTAMLTHVRRRCVEIFAQTLQAFYPEKKTTQKRRNTNL